MRSLLSYIRYDIPQGVQSLLYWAPVVWRWRAWDWSFTVDVLIHSLKAQRELEVRYKRHTNWETQARRMSVCIEALERLRHEDGDDMLELVPGDGLFGQVIQVKASAFYGSKKAVYEWEQNRRKMYLHIVSTHLNKYLLNWWD